MVIIEISSSAGDHESERKWAQSRVNAIPNEPFEPFNSFQYLLFYIKEIYFIF